MKTTISRERFEEIAQEAFDSLPDSFKSRVENVQIVVEDYPSESEVLKSKSDRYNLLGLYQGVPLTGRTTSYGMYAVGPDKITLYQKNIERACRTEADVERRIVEVLYHELGHYFGMNEKQIRQAMKNFK